MSDIAVPKACYIMVQSTFLFNNATKFKVLHGIDFHFVLKIF